MFYRVEMFTSFGDESFAFVDTMEQAIEMKKIAEQFNNTVIIKNGLTGEKID